MKVIFKGWKNWKFWHTIFLYALFPETFDTCVHDHHDEEMCTSLYFFQKSRTKLGTWNEP